MEDLPIHVVIPDSQVRPGVDITYLRWIGRYIVDHFAGRPNVKIVHLGDFADMPSLSSYDKGTAKMQGRTYQADIDAANRGWVMLNAPLVTYNRMQARKKAKQWWPERHILLGNHEDRITRALNYNPELQGMLTLDLLNYERSGWTVHPFLEPLFLDGVAYSHYFPNPMTGKPIGGMIETMLKTIGHSFTQGHVQTFKAGQLDRMDPLTGKPTRHRGLVAGACYLHDEEYKTPQGNAHWRGILVKHAVQRGNYNLMEVDLDYLCRRYHDMSLEEYRKDPW